MIVGKPGPYAPGKDFDDWDFTFNGYAGTLDPAYPATSSVPKSKTCKDHLNEFLELVRRYDEANGTDPVPEQVKKACIISHTPGPLETHPQLNVAKLGNFDASRVATEDYLRSRRIFKTTSFRNTHDDESMEVDAVSRRGKGKEKTQQGQEGWQKESHSGKGYGETTTEHSRFEGECRNCGKYGHKAADCWHKQTNKLSR